MTCSIGLRAAVSAAARRYACLRNVYMFIFMYVLTVFQITIPCKGKEKGVASLILGLKIYDPWGRPLKDTPLQFRLKKQCVAFGMYIFVVMYTIIVSSRTKLDFIKPRIIWKSIERHNSIYKTLTWSSNLL